MNFSYSTMADVFAIADENEEQRDLLTKFAQELEQMGIASYEGVEYMYRSTNYGMEIVSVEDFESEKYDLAEDE